MTDPLRAPERVAFAGDWHMNKPWGVSAIEYAADQGADVLLHVGDFGYTFLPYFLMQVSSAAERAGMPLLFVDGNHEDFPKLHRWPVGPNGLRQIAPMVWHIPRGFRWEWDGLRFLGLGGAHSVDGIWRRRSGDLWCVEERITPEQADEVAAAGGTDVLITHDCPAGVDIPGLGDDEFHFPPIEILRAVEHRELLRRVVDEVKPAQIWHGHYHRRYAVTADLGWGQVAVSGLDCDGTALGENVQVVELGRVAATVALARAGL